MCLYTTTSVQKIQSLTQRKNTHCRKNYERKQKKKTSQTHSQKLLFSHEIYLNEIEKMTYLAVREKLIKIGFDMNQAQINASFAALFACKAWNAGEPGVGLRLMT